MCAEGKLTDVEYLPLSCSQMNIWNLEMAHPGLPINNICTALKIEGNLNLEYLQTLSEKDILPGVQEFLEAARAKGYRTALGSASKNAVFILEKLKLSESFDAVIDGNKVSKAKPDPEVFLNGAAALGLAGCDCIVFEDAAAGIKAAHAGGMRAVGIGKPEILSEADYVIRGFEKITIEEIEQEIM